MSKRKRQPVKMHDDFPQICSKCGSNELSQIGNVREKTESFVHPVTQIHYTHTKRFYGRCKGCGQTRAVCRRIRRVSKPITHSGKAE